MQNIDYDNAIDLEFRHGMKQFFSGDVSQPVHSSGIKGKTGEHIHCLFQGMLLPEEDEHYLILGTIKDITTFSEKEQELETKAQADSLTGLFNHAHGMELVTQALLAKNPFDTCAFVIVDLDFLSKSMIPMVIFLETMCSRKQLISLRMYYPPTLLFPVLVGMNSSFSSRIFQK